jgi:cytochrome c oxidase subunit 2
LLVEVIGHQWWWEFRYPEYGVVTANELYLPAGRTVNLKMHSADVIHSFWVPRVGGKRDVNPRPRTHEGEREPRANYLTFVVDSAGYFSGQCAEFCGASHAIMRTAIVALPQDQFASWVSSMGGAQQPAVPQPATPADTTRRDTTAARTPAAPPATAQQPQTVPPTAQQPGSLQGPATPATPLTEEQRGQQLFMSKPCIACHTINGTNARGVLGPNLTRFGARRTVGAGARPNTLANVEAWIRHPQALKPGALMPGAREGAAGMPPTGLTDDEIRAIATYLTSLK